MKRTWESKKEWDEKLPEEMISEWKKFKLDLMQLRNIVYSFLDKAMNKHQYKSLNSAIVHLPVAVLLFIVLVM